MTKTKVGSGGEEPAPLYNVGMEQTTVIFTLPELWMLNSLIRHESEDEGEWKYPPTNAGLARDIAAAILLCEDDAQGEAALAMRLGDLLIVDYNVQASDKTPEGASGKLILLKVFRAMRALTLGPDAEGDTTYRAASELEKPVLEDLQVRAT